MKLELKENMYYRTYSGFINKIISIKDYNEREYLLNGFYINKKGTIKKARYNIIDILEVGDIVTTNNLCGEITKIDKEHDQIWTTCYDEEYCSSNDIKEVLTREQFKASSYRIGD